MAFPLKESPQAESLFLTRASCQMSSNLRQLASSTGVVENGDKLFDPLGVTGFGLIRPQVTCAGAASSTESNTVFQISEACRWGTRKTHPSVAGQLYGKRKPKAKEFDRVLNFKGTPKQRHMQYNPHQNDNAKNKN